MSVQLNLQPKNEKLYVPEKAKITKIDRFTANEKFFRLELASGKSLGHDPGQFVQVSILSIGEAPISISSPPGPDNTFEMCVRAVGDVTNKLHSLSEGDEILIRGPFGHGFDKDVMDRMQGKHLLFIGGGIIPKGDIPRLRKAGFAQTFGPGTPIVKISKFIETSLEVKDNDSED